MTSTPRAVRHDPYGFDDDAWLGLPSQIADRARPARPVESAGFWAGLRSGQILFDRCVECRRYTHYPVGRCQWCGNAVQPEEVDGHATVNTFAPCYLDFAPGMPVPYCVAIVNPVCEPHIQLMTNIVNCRISDIRIDMPVTPVIVRDGDVALLFYQPIEPEDAL
jgi:uncharacterized OB-fold protein